MSSSFLDSKGMFWKMIVLWTVFGLSVAGQQAPKTAREAFGVFGHFLYNIHSADFRQLPGVPNCCPRFESGSGSGFSLGLMYDLPFSQVFGLNARVGYSSFGGTLTNDEPVPVLVGTQTQNGIFTHTVDARLTDIGAELLGRARFMDRLDLYLGPRFGFLNAARYSQAERITSPSNSGVFVDSAGSSTGSRVRNESSGDVEDATAFLPAVLVGASYSLPLNSTATLSLVPEAFYQLGLSNLVQDLEWKVSSLRLGLSIRYSPEPAKEIRRIRDTVFLRDTQYLAEPGRTIAETKMLNSEVSSRSVEEIDEGTEREVITMRQSYLSRIEGKVPPQEQLTSNLRVVGVDKAGQEMPVFRVKVEEYLSESLHPILPYIFFENASDVLPPRYQRLNSTQTETFNPLSLHGETSLGVYYNVLNIIGARMRQAPESRLTLIGYSSDRDTDNADGKIGMRRAQAVQSYLSQTWGIAPERLKIEGKMLPERASSSLSAEGAAENRRVEMSSNDLNLLDVLIVRDTLRVSDPPLLRIYPSMSTASPSESWQISLAQSGQAIKNWQGSGALSALEWRPESDQKTVPKMNTPLDLQLRVRADGQSSQAQSSIGVDLVSIRKKREEKVGDKSISKYSLILFDFNSAQLGPANKTITQLIRSKIRPNSVVNITGHTDALGDEALNLRLSQARAKSVLDALGVSTALAEGKGEMEIYPNSVPEGRMYNRIVNVTVETPSD